ncbi:MAG: hypothetical protein KH452_02880 [Clostridiales bacterium]|nr:hypothetical protein [Clostridiales bacterium]
MSMIQFRSLAGALLTVLALSVDRVRQDEASFVLQLLYSFKQIDLMWVVLFFLLYRFYRCTGDRCREDRRSLREKLCCHVPAALFAVFMTLGYSYYMDNSWRLVFGNSLFFWKSVLVWVGYDVLFFHLIVWIYDWLGKTRFFAGESRKGGILGRYISLFRKYPFRTCFFTMLIVYLPYMILSCPGILTIDSKKQIVNVFQALEAGSGQLNNQHPVMHTLLIYGCMSAGRLLFGSAQIGVFLYSLFQFLFMAAAISYLMKMLVRLEASDRVLGAVMLFFLFSPRIQNYMFLMVKDVIFGGFLLFYLCAAYRVQDPEEKKRRGAVALLVFAAAGMFFFRQEGIYILLLTFLVSFFRSRKNRKLYLTMFAGFLLFSMVYQSVLLPACNVKSSNTRQLFSIPFQQTARYVRDAGDEVTAEEGKAIAAVLDYDRLAEIYNPNLSDPVKATFNRDATSEYLAEYFRVWFQMLKKHPDIYVQATMNNLYGYFYPYGYAANFYSYSDSAHQMEKVNEELAEYSLKLQYPEALDEPRTLYEDLREAVFALPVFSSMVLSGFYVWVLLLWGFYCIYRKNGAALTLAVPLFLILLVCMAGPTYGWYFRYLYALALCLPGTILMGRREII